MKNDSSSQTTPPVAAKKPQTFELHGDKRTDDYFWIREKTDPEVMKLLEAENAYTQSVLAPLQPLQDKLFEEMKARIQEDDADVPVKKGDWFYYSRMEAGRQYAIHCRKFKSLDAPEEIVLDENVLAEGKEFLSLGALEPNPDHSWIAYAVDVDGSERHEIHFKNLKTGEISPETIKGTHTSLEWAEADQIVFYTMLDEHDRPDRAFRHKLGEDASKDVLLYKEADPQLFMYLSKTRSDRFIFLECQGKVTSEIRYLDAKKPLDNFKVMEPRKRGVLYHASHHEDKFLITTNDEVQNFRLVEAPVTDPRAENWKEIRRGSPTLLIEGVDSFKDFWVIHERENGLPQLRVVDLKAKAEHVIEFAEPTYELSGEANAEYVTDTYRLAYTSLVTPNTVYDYNLKTRDRKVMKTQKIPSGYDPSLYASEYVFATAEDGTKIPISVVYKKAGFKKDGSHPLYLYGYGSYGMSMPARFSTVRLSLLDRGFVYAIAHIRGGSEMGRAWYEGAKFLTKKLTFTDFIACARHLAKKGFSKEGNIAISGGSAGGMLVGASLNMAPTLFKAAVADVPFVDVVNTMLDETLPLTPIEYEEWGNPNDKAYYGYMKSYSPYDNVQRRDYPHIFVTSGLNDPRVTYWEPAKWVAKLRELKTDKNLLLQYIHMGAGHGGPSGRYEALKEYAREYSFLFKVFGLKEAQA
jgi:oligopeptidase B